MKQGATLPQAFERMLHGHCTGKNVIPLQHLYSTCIPPKFLSHHGWDAASWMPDVPHTGSVIVVIIMPSNVPFECTEQHILGIAVHTACTQHLCGFM